MIDLKREGNDIYYNGHDFEPVADIDNQVEQRLTLRLGRFLGEWFLNTNKGVDFFGVVKVKNPNVEVINAALKAECMREQAVTEIIEWNTGADIPSRTFKVLPSTRLRLDTGAIISLDTEL